MRYNLSKTYLLPLLSEVVDIYSIIEFVDNTYIFDNSNKYTNCIFLKTTLNFKIPEYAKLEKTIINNYLYVDTIDTEEYIIYIFKFPEEYLHEYYSFIRGEYSKFGIDAKDLIIKFIEKAFKRYDISKVIERVNGYLFKNEEYKKILEKRINIKLPNNVELGDIINKKNETIVINERTTENV